MDAGMFDSVVPSRYISLEVPNPFISDSAYFSSKNIRISILDASLDLDSPSNLPKAAAMIVPKNRESDWIFSTKTGHSQLLFGDHEISRLILIGNLPGQDFGPGSKWRTDPRYSDSDFMEKLQASLHPLLVNFLPKINREVGDTDFPFLVYEDGLVSGEVLLKTTGPFVGEMMVEDTEIDEGSVKELRRRLRFKRMPNLVQTEIRLMPWAHDGGRAGGSRLDSLCSGEVMLQPDLSVLVHPYLVPMVASMSLINTDIQRRFDSGVRPRALCIGVGGGALLGFLATQLGFEVVGVELDEEVLRIARVYFGLVDGEAVRLCRGDGIEILWNMARKKSIPEIGLITHKFDVIMIDIDPSDSKMGNCAPPVEFTEESVLLNAKSCLSEFGLLVLNVIPSSRMFYQNLTHRFRGVFAEVHRIVAENEENVVVIGAVSPSENAEMRQLRVVIPGLEAYVKAMEKI